MMNDMRIVREAIDTYHDTAFKLASHSKLIMVELIRLRTEALAALSRIEKEGGCS